MNDPRWTVQSFWRQMPFFYTNLKLNPISGLSAIGIASYNTNKSAKGAYTWSSPVYLSMCEGSEYTSLSENYSKCNNFKAVGIG